MMKSKQDNDLIDRTGTTYIENYTQLLGLSDPMQFMTKSRQDNDVNDLIVVVYIEKKTELS